MLQQHEKDPSTVVLDWEDFEISCLRAIEKAFNRHLQEFEFSPPIRAGDVKRAVLSQLNQRTSAFCSAQRTFGKVRKAITSELGLHRSQVKLDVPLEQYFPKLQRRKSWQKVRKAIGLPFPNLRLSPFALSAIIVSVLLGSAAFWGYNLHFVVLIVFGALVCLAWFHFRIDLPCPTIRALVHQLLHLHYGHYVDGEIDPEEAEHIIFQILDDYSQCSSKEIGDETILRIFVYRSWGRSYFIT